MRRLFHSRSSFVDFDFAMFASVTANTDDQGFVLLLSEFIFHMLRPRQRPMTQACALFHYCLGTYLVNTPSQVLILTTRLSPWPFQPLTRGLVQIDRLTLSVAKD